MGPFNDINKIYIVVFIDVKPEPWYHCQDRILVIVLGCLLASAAVTTLAMFFVCFGSQSTKAKLKAKGLYFMFLFSVGRERREMKTLKHQGPV